MNEELNQILLKRHYIVSETPEDSNYIYYNSYLLTNFGIVVDNPKLVNRYTLETISELYHLNVPESFYRNPQDTKYFSAGELLLEQLLSYFVYESGNYDVARIEVFKKDLPDYVEDDKFVLRTVYMLTRDQANQKLDEIFNSYCAYTRPWSINEFDEFIQLFTRKSKAARNNDYAAINCADNAIVLIKQGFYDFAKSITKKDLVKLSVQMLGDKSNIKEATKDCAWMSVVKESKEILRNCLPLVKNCKLSKKQAKYYNKVCDLANGIKGKETNVNSPYKAAMKEFKAGNILEAAKIFADNGSLLQRNLKMLLSRASMEEAVQILDMIPDTNPIVLSQLVTKLGQDSGEARMFSFYANNRMKHHMETEYETKWRKSRLSIGQIKNLQETCEKKFDNHYASLESLGKVYVSDKFEKVALPTNTTASGKGIDVLPTGSRIPMTETKIRSFVYWKEVFDIDASLILIKENGDKDTIFYGNYSCNMDDAVRFSGDDRRETGAEYYDIDLDVLRQKGYKYVVQTINGYGQDLNKGTIRAGYQTKNSFNNQAWSAKNIAFEFDVKGDSRSAVNFAIDLTTNEVVVLNLVMDDVNRTVDSRTSAVMDIYLDKNYLNLNMARVARNSGEVVTTPEEADVVFDDTYVPNENQKVIRTYETEELVKLINR